MDIGDEVSSVHNPASRGTIKSFNGDGTANVLWQGYRVTERWHLKVLVLRDSNG